MWQPLASVKDCNPKATVGGTLYNSMIAPYTVGPMALKGATWYQGESSELRPPVTLVPSPDSHRQLFADVGGAGFYACAFPSMITRWREAFQDPDLWFGFVQIASFGYSHPYGRKDQRLTCKHSLANVSSFFEEYSKTLASVK